MLEGVQDDPGVVEALRRAGAPASGAVILLIPAGILFLPLSWNISLPGETVPAEHRLVAVPEGGYLTAALPRRAFP